MNNLTDIPGLTGSRWPEAPAVAWTSAAGGGGFTHAGLRDAAHRGAARLFRVGVRKGDRVLLAVEPRPEWAVGFFSILGAGAVVVPVPWDTTPEGLVRISGYCGATVAVTGLGTESADAGSGVAGLTRLDVARLAIGPMPHPDDLPPGASSSELAVLAFTSGSTGQPRAVELTHGSILADIRALRAVREAHPGDSVLSLLPPHHLFELTAGLLGPLACGARVVYPGALLPNRLLAALGSEHITHVMCVPALLEMLYAEVREGLAEEGGASTAERVRARLGPALRSLIVGGAALDPAWWQRAKALGIPLEVGYGLTEASPVVSLGRVSDCPPGSVGRPLPGVEVRTDENGEILVRGANLMRGYHRDPAATAAAIEDGWLRTGDLGRIDADGFLFVTGRLKEAMVSANGETVHPDEVEPHYASPLFREWCVVGVPDSHGNDLPTLFAVPVDPALPADALREAFEDLRCGAPARCRVARFIVLDRPLPRTATGKIRRRLLVPGCPRAAETSPDPRKEVSA